MSQPSRVYINSYYRRPQDSANDFVVNLPTQIINPKVMSINSATIPLLAYNIPTTESRFYFQTGDAPTVVKSFVLNTAKVYSAPQDFLTDFQALLASAKAGTTANLEADGRLTIVQPAGINVIGIANREYNWNSTYFDNCANRLGFYNASPGLETTPFPTTFTGTGVFTLIRTSSIFVCVDVIAGDSYTTNSPEQTISTILFHLPVTNPDFGGINIYTNQDYLLFKATDLPYSIYNINVRLLDDNFDDLDLLPSAKTIIELSFQYDNSTSIPAEKL